MQGMPRTPRADLGVLFAAVRTYRSPTWRLRWFAVCWSLCWPLTTGAQSDPLTLEQALAMADLAHPDLDMAQARVEGAQADFTQVRALTGVRSYLDITPQSVHPSSGPETGMVGDSRARLTVSKRLYDFGRSQALEDSARSIIEARQLFFFDAHQRRRIEIMQRFFDVILADLRYAADNETMAHTYVAFDRGRDRHGLGQISDVDLLELEQRYQQTLVIRTLSQKRQASSRLQLALAMNRPEELPHDLRQPALAGNEREVPEVQVLYAQARASNPALLALRHETEAARLTLTAERARRRPVLTADGEAAWYEREFNSRDELRATLNLRIPLYQGGEDSAAIAAGLARLHEQEARLGRAELDLRQTVLDLVQEAETRKVERAAARVKVSYRDLYLDRSRALYELEVRTDLGDAMAQMTAAQWEAAQAEFRLALAWAKIDALTGNQVGAKPQEKLP
jgi:outer membrane protein TolC